MNTSLLVRIRSPLAVVICLVLVLSMLALPNPPMAYAADRQNISVKVTDTSSNIASGYWVEYDINGIKYRSDTAGTRINQMAWEHMSVEDRVTTMEKAFGWMIHIRKRQFDPQFSAKMAEWYDTYSGWIEGRKILADRLAQINFPAYQAHYNVNNRYSYYETNFKPSFPNYDCDDFPETLMLYEELEACWKWAYETYDAMSHTQQIQTGMAVTSISGDLIKLITDRCLVPNITPSGVSTGLASKTIALSAEIFGIYDGILGNLDNIQAKVIGEKMDAENVRIIIESLTKVIEQDKLIIDKCEARMRALKSEIEQKVPALRAEQEQKSKELVDAAEAEDDAILSNSPITGTDNESVATTIRSRIAEYEALKRSDFDSDKAYNDARAAKQNAIKSYCQTTYDQAVSDLTAWCTTYFGTTAVASYTDDSIVGSYVKNYPKAPVFSSKSEPQPDTTVLDDKTMQSIGTFPEGKGLDVYMTSDELSTVEAEVKSYAQSFVTFNEKCLAAYQAAQPSATAARSGLSRILSVLNALKHEGKDYYAGSDSQQTVVGNMSAYLSMINAYGSLDYTSDGTYPEGLTPGSLSGEQWIKLRDCEGSIAWAQEQKDYYDASGEFLTLFATAKEELGKAQDNIRHQTAVFKKYEDDYAQAWQEYRELDAERKDILDALPGELNWVCGAVGNNPNNEWNSMFDWRNPKGTMADVKRVGAESSSAIQGLLTRDAQLGKIAWKIQMCASTLDNLSTRTSPYGNYKETYGIGSVLEANTNETLNSGATQWKGITEQGWSDWGKEGAYADGISTAYLSDNLSYMSTIPGNIYAEEQLTSISEDCSGRSFSREQWLMVFSNLNDNFTLYSTTKSDGEGGYEDQKREANRLRNGAYMGGIDKAIAKAGVKSTEPDPQDLAEPWFEAIDRERIKNGVDPTSAESTQPTTPSGSVQPSQKKANPLAAMPSETTQASKKKANPMVAKGLTKTVKLGKAKKLKKAATVAKAVRFTTRPKGTVSYTRVAKGSAKCLTIAKKTGKITVKKGTKAGTYKLKAKVRASGNAAFKAKTQKVTVTIRVRA